MIGDGNDARTGTSLALDQRLVLAFTLVLGGSVIALVGQHTAAQAGPAIVLSLLLAALGAMLVLCCVHVMMRRSPTASGLHALLVQAWGRPFADLLGVALLLELVVTLAGSAQSAASHLHAALQAAGMGPVLSLPLQVTAAAGLLVLGAIALLQPRQAVLVACVLLTLKVGIGLLLLMLAARYVHYAHWVPWLPAATAPYRFGVGGVLAAAVPLLGVFASIGLVLAIPTPPTGSRPRLPAALALAVLVAMLLLIVLAALQSGLVEFPALAGTRPLSMAVQGHPQLQWMLPLLPLAGWAGLAALQLVLLMLASPLATAVSAAGRTVEAGANSPVASPVAAMTVAAAVLALWLPGGTLPSLPGGTSLLVMAALCAGGLRLRAACTPMRWARPLFAVAATLCLLPAVQGEPVVLLAGLAGGAVLSLLRWRSARAR